MVNTLRCSKLIQQCNTFQRYGHTQNYLEKTKKCAGGHPTINCTKPTKSKPECSNYKTIIQQAIVIMGVLLQISCKTHNIMQSKIRKVNWHSQRPLLIQM